MNNQFDIRQPFWGAWTKYGWQKGDWGIGLNKDRIDKLAEKNENAIVKYYKSDWKVIEAKKVQKYPLYKVDFNTLLYIVKKSALKEINKIDLSDPKVFAQICL